MVSLSVVYITWDSSDHYESYSGGAGGKGTWGKLTEVYDEDGHTHDARDPNYDSIEEDVSFYLHAAPGALILLVMLIAGAVCGLPFLSPHVS